MRWYERYAFNIPSPGGHHPIPLPVHMGEEMSETNSGPALPTAMPLRDYFAGQALAGMLTRTDVLNCDQAVDVARDAYLVADAMLKARRRTGEAA